MESDWKEVYRVAPLQQHAVSLPLRPTAIAFDTTSELLYVGTDEGYIQSFEGCELRKYTSFRAHTAPPLTPPTDKHVRQILTNRDGVVSISAKSVHMSKRGGPALWNVFDDRFKNLTSMAFTSRGTSEMLVGGAQVSPHITQSSMFTVNLDKGTIGAEIPTDYDVNIMKRTARHIAVGSSGGDVRLLDMNSFQVVKHFEHVHSSGIMDMDTHDNYLVTCGYSFRHNSFILDPLVRVFDIRVQKSLPPISFINATFIKMHPKLSGTAIIANRQGKVDIVDVNNPGATKSFQTSHYTHTAHTAHNQGTVLTQIELSPSGDVLAMMDSDGVVQMWSAFGKRNFTEFGAPVEWPEPPTRPSIVMTDTTPLNSIGMPYFSDPLLSNWDPNMIFEVPNQPHQKIDPETIAATAGIGYAPFNKRYPRNYVASRTRANGNGGLVTAPMFLSQQGRSNSGFAPDSAPSDTNSGHGDEANGRFEVPALYRKHNIKYSKFGIDDFNFGYFNKTKYSGLETNIPNCYMNPLLQLYKYTPRLRNVALFHTATACTIEMCLLCQMGFLFDMLEKANGLNCQATNLLSTFSALPNAARHGVLDDESNTTTNPAPMMIQSLNRFLLDQTIFELKNTPQPPIASEESELPQVLLIRAVKRQQCMICHKETRPMGDTVTTDLIYPLKPPGHKSLPSFAQIVRQSIQLESTQKGWCDRCKRYQSQHTRKTITKLPDVLTFNVTSSDKNLTHARDYCSQPGWLPDEIGLSITNKMLNVWQGDDLKRVAKRNNNDQVDLRMYELVGFVAQIKEEGSKKHMVSFINVALSDENRVEGESKWHVFNDFRVDEIPKATALDFTPKWKMPLVLCFQLKHERSKIDNRWKDLLDTSLLYNDSLYLGETRQEEQTILLNRESEVPKAGTLVALDAEFVELHKEESEIKADGTKEIITPGRQGLARVSVLRGAGELEGVPFIDDYIAIKVPVVDYLTAYSGIHPGDLDPHTSRRALVSLKVAYKRMWILLNLGCTFVGHGLLKDFRIINIHIPKDQVIDTVNLYALRATSRKLSLRFLAWVVLSDLIQTETHDSIEDANTALRLYKKYLEFEEAGVFEQMMQRIFNEGIRYNYKPPTPPNAPIKDVERLQLAESGVPRSEGSTPQPMGAVEK